MNSPSEDQIKKIIDTMIDDIKQNAFYYEVERTNEVIDGQYEKIDILDPFYDMREIKAYINLNDNNESENIEFILSVDIPVQNFSIYYDQKEERLFLPNSIKFESKDIKNIYIEFDKMQNKDELLSQYDESTILSKVKDLIDIHDTNINIDNMLLDSFSQYLIFS